MKSLVIASMFSAALAFGVPAMSPVAYAVQQKTTTADQDAEKAKAEAGKAGDDAKEAAKKAGSATKHAAKATAKGTKSTAKTVGKDTKNASKAVADDTKDAAKTTGSDVKNVGAAIKGDVTGDHKNATAKCTDGTFWYSTERAGACVGHGGVAAWMAK